MSEEKIIRIALAGNPNCGKTTLFNALTGSNQFVGNWPGVTVEKKEGKLKKHNNVIITDLPGIYSLSPYTLEEVVARNYLLDEAPEAILNIVDGTNLERNLYLTTQLAELGIPMIVAINMMDIVRKNGDQINIAELSRELGCPVIEISALRGDGVTEAAQAAIAAAQQGKTLPMHTFSGPVEHAIAHIEEAALHDLPPEKQRWYAIKIFERDAKALEKLAIPAEKLAHIEQDIVAAEKELDDDAESIITSERYVYIAEVIKGCYRKRRVGGLSASDKIDRIVTNRWLGLPILAAVMFLVYYIAMVTVGQSATDWANDGLFGDGFHLFGVGAAQYEEAAGEFGDAQNAICAFIKDDEKLSQQIFPEDAEAEAAPEADTAEKIGGVVKTAAEAINAEVKAAEEDDSEVPAKLAALKLFAKTIPADKTATLEIEDEETLAKEKVEFTGKQFAEAIPVMEKYQFEEPDPANYGWYVPGVPVLVEDLLDKMNCSDWLKGLILGGIVAGVGSVLGFVPQMLVLFFLLAYLEACGYMARIAFVLDRIFRRFGLSGKSFIPMLVGMGCGVPGVMASRTIENEHDRRMTIMTTTFVPCGAKVPFIALVAGAIFGGSAWVATSAYFVGLASIILSGIMLKKTPMFAGMPSPFVMELPPYHLPLVGNVLRSMWERGWSFIKKAGTIILLSTVFVWFTSFFGWVDGAFQMLDESQLDCSILARIGAAVAWVFAPLGWGNWQAAVASFTGLVAKENIVGTLGILYQGEDGEVYQNLAKAFVPLAGYSFLMFNLLCAPCFAAIGAIKREMNNAKWTIFAIAYQTIFAYVMAMIVYQIGSAINGNVSLPGVIVSAVLIVLMLIQLFRPYRSADKF